MIFNRPQTAVNSALIKIEASNFQRILSYLYAAEHIEKNTWLCIMIGVGMPWKRQNLFVSLRALLWHS